MILRLEEKLKNKIAEAMKAESPDFGNFSLEPAPVHVNADLSLPWPLAVAKALKRNPMETAGKICGIIEAGEGVKSAEAARPGFVNINLDDGTVFGEMTRIAEEKESAYKIGVLKGKINLEFVSANPTGPLHLASGRAAAIGDSLARIFRFAGHDLSSEYYVNDAGRQVEILGQSLKDRFFGREPSKDGYKGNYLAELAGKLPREAENWTLEKFASFAAGCMIETHKTDLENVGVEFNEWFRESDLHAKGAVQETLEILEKKGLACRKDGAVWFGLGEEKDDKDRVLVRSDGRSTYFLNDIAYHLDKCTRGFNNLIDVWGADHHGYIPRMKAAMEGLAPEINFTVVLHQLVLLKKDGESVKMSKREGEFVSLRELTEEVGRDACRFFFSARSPNSHLNFDVDLARKKTSENPVFYVQYVHARICSVFARAGEKGISLKGAPAGKISLNDEEKKLALKILWFGKTLFICMKDLSPHHLTTYLVDLSSLFHSFYDKHRVLDKGDPGRTFIRLRILKSAKFVIKTGLGLLGVSAPEKM